MDALIERLFEAIKRFLEALAKLLLVILSQLLEIMALIMELIAKNLAVITKLATLFCAFVIGIWSFLNTFQYFGGDAAAIIPATAIAAIPITFVFYNIEAMSSTMAAILLTILLTMFVKSVEMPIRMFSLITVIAYCVIMKLANAGNEQ